jgi:hypothetical protein
MAGFVMAGFAGRALKIWNQRKNNLLPCNPLKSDKPPKEKLDKELGKICIAEPPPASPPGRLPSRVLPTIPVDLILPKGVPPSGNSL